MFKRILKWLGATIAVVVIAIAIFLVNLIWFRPWSLNLFYEKVFAEILFDHPEILSTLGLVEQFGITGHNGKLDDEIARASTARIRKVEARLGTTSPGSGRSPIGFAKAFHTRVGLVFAATSRG